MVECAVFHPERERETEREKDRDRETQRERERYWLLAVQYIVDYRMYA